MRTTGRQNNSERIDIQDSNDLKRRLSGVVNLYFRVMNWSLGWTLKVRAEVPRHEIDGFFLHHEEMELLHLDLSGILMRLSERSFLEAMSMPPPLDYWSRAISRYAFRVNPDTLEWSVPGFDVPEIWRVERLQFHPDPRHLPMSNILEAFRGYALPLGLDPAQFVFEHDGLRIEECSTLVDNVMAAETPTSLVMTELRRWRQRMFDLIASAKGCEGYVRSESTDAVQATAQLVPTLSAQMDAPAMTRMEAEPEPLPTAMDPRLRGHMISRAMMARILQKSVRTLKNWDRAGMVSTGEPWSPPDITGTNRAMYDVSRNWQTMLSLMPAERDCDRDRQLARELLELSNPDAPEE